MVGVKGGEVMHGIETSCTKGSMTRKEGRVVVGLGRWRIGSSIEIGKV
jgi:hypothetical protein